MGEAGPRPSSGGCPPISRLPASSCETYLDGLRLGGELPLQVCNLVGGGLLQLLQGALEMLHILQQPQDLSVLGGQGSLQPRARAQREVHLILGTKRGLEGPGGVGQGLQDCCAPPE